MSITLISSDTNIWLDFEAIGELEVPFLLPYTYLMARKAITNEILRPEDLASRLKGYGLKGVTLDEAEELLVEAYSSDSLPKCFRRLTNYDRMALAIAKNRGIMLLTGDNYLRQAAEAEHVPYMGTIGLLDKLNEAGFKEQYSRCCGPSTIH